jgi:hypothetical protein
MFQFPTKQEHVAFCHCHMTRDIYFGDGKTTWLGAANSLAACLLCFGSRSPIKIRKFLNMVSHRHRRLTQEPKNPPTSSLVRSSRIGEWK